MRRLRLVVHALDRTGPPVLARTFAGWLRSHRPDVVVDLVAFRGGPLAADLAEQLPVTVLLEPHEPWDHHHPDPARVQELRDRTSSLPAVDVTLLVSVAAGQALPLLADLGPTVTWVVEQGEDLHWIDEPVGLAARTTSWIAGAEGSRREAMARLGDVAVGWSPEFVDEPQVPSGAAARDQVRAELGAGPDHLLVVGAGIATHRKAPDLFVELALLLARTSATFRFAWVGGEHDPLHGPLGREVHRLGLDDVVRLVPSVPDLDPLLAAADVLAHPARLDAFPLVCLHAALLGVPVVGFAEVAALEEMFGPAFLGAPYPDLPALADVLRSLVDGPARRAAGAAQQDRVRARFTASSGAPLLVAHLERAVAA